MQCELWTDNNDMEQPEYGKVNYAYQPERDVRMVAGKTVQYGESKNG